MNIYSQLAYEFAKIALFAIGGGLASIPFLYVLSDKTAWFSHADLANMIAIAESTPGPIGLNMSTYVGFTTGGIPGGIIATVAFVLPSIVIGIIVARIFARFKANPHVEAMFYGIRPAVCGLIGAAAFKIMTISLLRHMGVTEGGTLLNMLHLPGIVLFAFLTFMTFKVKWHPVVFIAFAAAVGILLNF